MPNLTASVGQGGRILAHDVAVVQAALAVLKGPDLNPLWSGPVDGQYQRYAAAITAFQAMARQPEADRIDANGPAPQALERLLPPSHKNLSGLKGTAAVFRGPGGFRPWEALARKTVTSASLPKAERQALSALQKRIGEELGLCLDFVQATITRDGRIEIRLSCAETEWVDPATKRFRIDGRMPGKALWLMATAVTGNAIWRAAVRAGDHPTFDLASARQIDALKGPARLDQAALNRFRITNPPMDPVADACIAACARLLSDGGGLGVPAKRDFDTLIEILENAAPDAAKRIILAEGHDQDDRHDDEPFEGRKLTAREISLARSVFGNVMDYDSVLIFDRPGLPYQPEDTAVSFDGNIYALRHGSAYSDDYASEGVVTRALFLHEMTHVWQFQRGIWVWLRGPFERKYDYLPLVPGKNFEDYNIEQQGRIVEHYYFLREGLKIKGASPISTYEALIPFVGGQQL